MGLQAAFFLLLVMVIKPRASNMFGIYSTTELYPSHMNTFLEDVQNLGFKIKIFLMKTYTFIDTKDQKKSLNPEYIFYFFFFLYPQ